MSTGDGVVHGLVPVHVQTDVAYAVNIVLVSEGYRHSELPQFARHAQQFSDHLLTTAPMTEARCGLNVFRVDVSSREAGLDDPTVMVEGKRKCGGPVRARATYFDASLCGGGLVRGIDLDENLVRKVVNNFLPQWHLILVLVNSPEFAGMGGSVAKTTISERWLDVAIHEMGHSLFGLADEYEYLDLDSDDHQEWPNSSEPDEPNLTLNDHGEKWADLVTPGYALPTKSAISCTEPDNTLSPVPSGTVGAFEGGGTYKCKVFRPEHDCMMRHSGQPFCAVCSRTIRNAIGDYHLAAVSPAENRFRHTNNYAAARKHVGAIPTFGQVGAGIETKFETLLVYQGYGVGLDVLASDLGAPVTVEDRFRAVNSYAIRPELGYVGGFPNFHQADYGQGTVYGCIFLPASAAVWEDVPATALGDPQDFSSRMIAVSHYAQGRGYAGGFPTFHENLSNGERVYGCVFVRRDAGLQDNIPIKEFGAPVKRLNDAGNIKVDFPSEVKISSVTTVTVRVTNTGTATWTSAGGYRLGLQFPQDLPRWGAMRAELREPVLPGRTAWFSVDLTAPPEPNTYSLGFRMVQESIEWFGDFSEELQVAVVAPPPPPPPRVKVPEVIGLTRTGANRELKSVGLRAKFEGATGGQAWVYRQTPRPGRLVAKGSEVECRCKEGPPA